MDCWLFCSKQTLCQPRNRVTNWLILQLLTDHWLVPAWHEHKDKQKPQKWNLLLQNPLVLVLLVNILLMLMLLQYYSDCLSPQDFASLTSQRKQFLSLHSFSCFHCLVLDCWDKIVSRSRVASLSPSLSPATFQSRGILCLAPVTVKLYCQVPLQKYPSPVPITSLTLISAGRPGTPPCPQVSRRLADGRSHHTSLVYRGYLHPVTQMLMLQVKLIQFQSFSPIIHYILSVS